MLTQFGKEGLFRHNEDLEVRASWVVKVGVQADDDSYKQTAELSGTEEKNETTD